MTAPREARPVTDRHRERIVRLREQVFIDACHRDYAHERPAGYVVPCKVCEAIERGIAAALADAEPGGREAREEARPRCPTEHRWACPDCGTEILDTYEWEDAENERLRAVVEAARTVSLQAMPHALKVALAALSSAPVEARPSAVEGERDGLA